jgi:hypothetical protein
VAILVSFPIGGYLADLVVDGVDSMGAALVGGLIAGLVIGAAEWFALRRWVSQLWTAATSIGMAAGLTVGAALVDYGISRGELLLIGVVTGLGVGALQALMLGRPLEHAARTSSTSKALTDIDQRRPRTYPLSRPLMTTHQPIEHHHIRLPAASPG